MIQKMYNFNKNQKDMVYLQVNLSVGCMHLEVAMSKQHELTTKVLFPCGQGYILHV